MANVPISNITATWDDAAQTFYGFRLTVTDTLYNSSSKIFDLLTTGGSKFSVDVAGNVNIAGNITSAAQDVHLSNNTTSSVYIHSGSQGAGANLYLAGAGTLTTVSMSVGYTGATLRSPNSLSWTSGTAINTSSDTGLSRYSAGVVKITDGSTGFGSLYAAGIGVGTTTPGELVDVVGNVQAVEFIGSLRGAVLFKAKAGEALTKGDVVYISGISGNTTVVSKADANDGSKMPAFGLVKETASSQSACEVYTFGTFQGLDTSSYTEGTELFVSTTAGGLTDTPPSGESSLIQKIAKVTRSHASAGSIKVIGAGRTNATPNLNNGNIFIGNASNQASTASLSSYLAPYAPIASPTFTGTVTVSGDLNVTGTTTTINTTNLDVQDAVITLNKGQVTPANDIGLLFQRYSTPTASNYNVAIAWDESSDKFIFGKTPETGSDNDLTFNTELLTISESGDTTINATGTALTADTSSSNLAQFARNGSTLINLGGSSSSGQFWLEGSVGGNLSFGRENVTADFVMTNSTHIGGGTELFRVTSGGNVGIGTNAPTAKLHVAGTADQSIIVQSTDNNGKAGVNFKGAGDRGSIYGTASYDIHIEPNAQYGQADVIINSANGTTMNVGIGTSAPAAKLHIADTFNDVSTVHTAFKLDVTDTASAAGSMVIDAQVGGTSKFTVDNAGGTTITGTLGVNLESPSYQYFGQAQGTYNTNIGGYVKIGKFNTAGKTGLSIVMGQNQGTNDYIYPFEVLSANGSTRIAGVRADGILTGSILSTANVTTAALSQVVNNNYRAGLNLNNASVIAWSSNATWYGAKDLELHRDAAGTLAQRNGTNAQTFNIYNTYTDASNYERGFMKWDASKLQIGTEASGTGAVRDMRLSPSSGNIYIPAGSGSGLLSSFSSGTRLLADNGVWINGYNGGLHLQTAAGPISRTAINAQPGILTTSSTNDYGIFLAQTLNVTTANAGAAYNAFKINVTETDITGWDSVNLIDAQVGGTSKFTVANTGDTVVDGALTFASDGAGGNWLKFYRQQTNYWRLTTSGIGDVFTVVGNSITFPQNVTIQRGGLLVQPTLTSTAEPFKGLITFNDVTKTYSAFKLDVTDTASAAGSTLIDAQVGGTSKFTVDTAGGVTASSISLSNIGNPAAIKLAGNTAVLVSGVWNSLWINSNGLTVGSNGAFKWTDGFNNPGTTIDTQLQRDSAGIVKVTDGSTGLGSLKASSILLSTDASLTSETATLATVSATQVASFPTTHLGAKLVIQAADTVSGERQISELTIIHDGTTVSVAEYGIVHTGSAALASYTAAIVSTNVIVRATGASANSTTYKVVETLI